MLGIASFFANPDSDPMQGETTLIFDGMCGFCTACVLWLQRHTRQSVNFVPWQTGDYVRFDLTEEQVRSRAWWIEDSQRYPAHRAVTQALRSCGGPWKVLASVFNLIPLRWLMALGYLIVAKNRRHLPGTTAACKRPPWQGTCHQK